MKNILSIQENIRINEINMISVIKKLNTNITKSILKINEIQNFIFEVSAYSFESDKTYKLSFILSKVSKKYENIENKNDLINKMEFFELGTFYFTPKGFSNKELPTIIEPEGTYVGFTKGVQGRLILDFPKDLEEGSYELNIFYGDKILSICPFDIV